MKIIFYQSYSGKFETSSGIVKNVGPMIIRELIRTLYDLCI